MDLFRILRFYLRAKVWISAILIAEICQGLFFNVSAKAGKWLCNYSTP